MTQKEKTEMVALIRREIRKNSGVGKIVGAVTRRFHIPVSQAEDALQLALERGVGLIGGDHGDR